MTETPASIAAPVDSPIALDFEILKNNWNEYVHLAEKDGKKALAAGMRKANLILNGTQLNIQVGNKAIADLIGEDRIALLAFLNTRAGKGLLRFEVEVQKMEEKSEKLYTLEERYNSMLKSNPSLAEFVSKLGLQLDY